MAKKAGNVTDDPDLREKRRLENELRQALREYFSGLQDRVLQEVGASLTKMEKHLPGEHDQADHGRKKGKRLSSSIDRHGGFSYNPVTRKSPKTGYMVSVSPEHEKVYSREVFTPGDIDSYASEKKKIFEENDNAYLGGWYDQDAKKIYLDISVNVQDQNEASQLAIKNGQEGFYDLVEGKTVIVKPEDQRRI